MKQFFITIAALLAFVGCVTEIADPQVGEPEQVAEFVKLNIELSAAGETKAIKSSWEEGDNIYLYFLEENDTTFTKTLCCNYLQRQRMGSGYPSRPRTTK